MYEWFLETIEDADVSVCFVLNDIREYTIGRRKGYDIVSKNPLVSRNHGVITVKFDQRVYIRDSGSANGTFINDVKIKPFKDILLKRNDLLGIGAPSTAIEQKKEIFRVRREPLGRRTTEDVVSKEADSTNIEDYELLEIDEAENLELEDAVSSSIIAKVPNLTKDVNPGNKNLPDNASNKSSNYLTTGYCKSSDSVRSKEINLNESIIKFSDVKIKKEKETVENRTTNNIIKPFNDTSSSTNDITNLDSINKNSCDIKKPNKLPTLSENKVINSESKNKHDCDITKSVELPSTSINTIVQSCFKSKNISEVKKPSSIQTVNSACDINHEHEKIISEKDVDKTKISNVLSSTDSLNKNDKNCNTTTDASENCNNLPEKIIDTEDVNDQNVKLHLEYKSLIDRHKKIKSNIERITVCEIKTLSDEPSSSSIKTVNSAGDINPDNEKIISEKIVAKTNIPDVLSSTVSLDKNVKICKISKDTSEHFNNLSEKIIDTEDVKPNVEYKSLTEKYKTIKTNNKHITIEISEEKENKKNKNDNKSVQSSDLESNNGNESDVKLNVKYKSLNKKRKTIETNIEHITINTSSEEGNNKTKTDKKSYQSSDSKSNNGYESDDIFENIKTEFKNHSFTQNDDDDIVIISDDDDDEFPKSQLFNDYHIKREPVENDNQVTAEGSTSPSSDNNDNHDNIFSTIVKNEIHEDDDIENEEDAFDDDCILWYHKLSQSQDFTSTKKKVELPDRSNEAEKDDFFKLDDRDLEIFKKDVEKPLDEESLESRSTAIDNDEHSKSKDVDAELEEVDRRFIETSIPSCSKLPSPEEKEKSEKKKDSKKSYVKPPVIDAPFLKKGKRKAHEEDKSKENTSSKSKRRKSIHDELPSVPVSVNSTVQSSVRNIDKSVREELDKRHKQTRKRRKSTETLTKNEKQRIQEDRKKKLKELASKITDGKQKEEIQKTQTKPKVKVSTGRGLFLTSVESKPEEKKKKSKSTLEEEPWSSKRFKIPKMSNSVSGEASTIKISTISEPNCSTINKLSFNNLMHKKNDTSVESSNETNESNVIKINKLTFNSLGNNTVESPRRLSTTSNNNTTYTSSRSNGILLNNDINRKSGKRVRFKEQPEIRFIERIGLKKVETKDAPIPVINNRDGNEILTIILDWRPAWLDEQKRFEDSPQVYKRKPLRMISNFNTVGDYFDIVTPLMLLELWRSIFKDWCCANTPVRLACVDSIQPRPDGLYLNCYCLTDRSDSDNYPRTGDFFIAEFYLDDENLKMATLKRFGYVVNVFKRRMIPTDVIHKQFIDMGPVPQHKVSFTMVIKNLQVKILRDKLMRIRLVSRISPMLRLFKAVSYINNSPLCKYILKPTVQQYKITKPTQMTSAIEVKLNNDQMMCVYEAYQICTRNEPGIYLIQGPPGTGKSFVIKNLIHQLLNDSTKPNAPKCRILLCAPSNGAIDELANSLLEMRNKMSKRLKMIRLGPPNAIVHPKVKQISVPELVEKHLQIQRNSTMKTNPHISDEYNFLMKKENTLKNKIMCLEGNNSAGIERNVDCSLDKQSLKKVQDKLLQLKTNVNTYQERIKQEREAEITLIENAEIICTTLFSCIGSKLENMVAEKKMEFTCCIIDEATQSSEQESLIPLLLGINKLVLVGDPQQLPPTTISQEAKNLGYGTSLFSRIQSCLEHLPENPIRMLTYQYRMHPEICNFPSNKFYGARLVTAEEIVRKAENILHPCRLFCLNTTKDYEEGEYLNKAEANLVFLITDVVLKRTNYNVGIITPYNKQKDYLISTYKAMRSKENGEKLNYMQRVVVNTVDGFQGQERDVIIISSVRYKSNKFLNDEQRLNVALTRAKHAVYICANAELFKAKSVWHELEIDAKRRNFFCSLTEKDASDERYLSELIPRLILRP